jgi:signal transduction histidine kinase
VTSVVSRIAGILGLAALYIAVGRPGLELDAVGHFATLVWPPTGVALAVLFLGGGRLWPGVWLGATVVNLWTGAPWPVAAGIAVGNTLEALGGWWMLSRLGFRPEIARVRDALVLVAAAALTPSLSAGIGVLSLCLGGVVAPHDAGETLRAWWIGDAISDVVVAPLILVWWTQRGHPAQRARWAEVAALVAALGLAAVVVFGRRHGNDTMLGPYLLFPPLMWATLSFGLRGATAATLLTSGLAIWSTAAGRGPYVQPRLAAGLLGLQLFLAVMSTTFMLFAAAVEERRRLLAELRAAIGARDAFISVASHELRTPLTALKLQVQRLSRRATRPPAAGAAASSDAAAGAQLLHPVTRLERLVDTLLDASRIQAGRLAVEREPVDLAALVREVCARFREERGSDYPLTVTAPDSLVGTWDRMRLDQITDNLVSNALKYGGGKPIEVSVEGHAETARLTVRDHGPGIAAADQLRIFERFERAGVSGGVPGLGLGLWIVRESARALGGDVTVTSSREAGSTFVVSLPLRPA